MSGCEGKDGGLSRVSDLSDCMLVRPTSLFIEVENFKRESFVLQEVERDDEF